MEFNTQLSCFKRINYNEGFHIMDTKCKLKRFDYKKESSKVNDWRIM